MAPSFLGLMSLHADLEERFLLHQERVLASDVAGAGATLADYRARLAAHMDDEEARLLPVYAARAGRIPGGPIELFLGEHRKMRDFLAGFQDDLARLRDARGRPLARGLITLFDREAVYKHLVEHHDRREQNILYPQLDRVTSEEERAALLGAETIPRGPHGAGR